MRDPFSTALPMTPGEALDALEESLGTLHRWRTSRADPQRQARQRLAELLSLHDRVRGILRTRAAVRRWFHDESSHLGGITPAEAIRVGRSDRVEAALEALRSDTLQ